VTPANFSRWLRDQLVATELVDIGPEQNDLKPLREFAFKLGEASVGAGPGSPMTCRRASMRVPHAAPWPRFSAVIPRFGFRDLTRASGEKGGN